MVGRRGKRAFPVEPECHEPQTTILERIMTGLVHGTLGMRVDGYPSKCQKIHNANPSPVIKRLTYHELTI